MRVRGRDITNCRFGRLLVLRPFERVKGRQHWVCQCDCGNIHTVRGDVLKLGYANSCGCFRYEAVSTSTSKYRRKLNNKPTPEFKVWQSMKNRCRESGGQRGYSDRGIKVCDAWAKSFDAFMDDMGPRPSLAHSIDRIDVNGNYEPGNCRWATGKEQNRNRRNNRLVTHNGKTMCVAAWCEELGLQHGLVLDRLDSGWTDERALTEPNARDRDPKRWQSAGFSKTLRKRMNGKVEAR
jgi:hypothetical protein